MLVLYVSDTYYFFVLLIPKPQHYTLFPYTTLFRANVLKNLGLKPKKKFKYELIEKIIVKLPKKYCNKSRSEEHTSELQSLAYLVCRILLEKKNISDLLQ